MFQGTTPPALRSTILGIARQWDCNEIYVGCSGNFTIERSLMELGKKLHSNDVSLYSSAIGYYLAGTYLDFSFNDQFEEEYGFMKETMGDPLNDLATLLLASDIAQAVGRDNPYYNRLKYAYQSQWTRMQADMVKRISTLETKFKINSYFCGDVSEHLKNCPEDAGFVFFPPYYRGGYEVMFKRLEMLFTWKKPNYVVMDLQDNLRMFKKVVDEKKMWAFGSNYLLEDYEPYLTAFVQMTNRAMPGYFYASHKDPMVVTPDTKTEYLHIPHFSTGREVGEHIEIREITGPEYAHVRSVYFNPKIQPAPPLMSLAVTVDGYLVGALAYVRSTGRFADTGLRTPEIYLLSAFGVSPSDYPRLSKLVIIAGMSTEVQEFLETKLQMRVRSMITTAFSQHDQSMAYHGLMKLINRVESEDPAYKWKLNYGANLGQWSLNEGFELWKKKYGTRYGNERRESNGSQKEAQHQE